MKHRSDKTPTGNRCPHHASQQAVLGLCFESVFALQVCARCGDAHLPPSPVCPKCLSEDQAWKPASGRGTLESWADFHRAYWDGFKDELPYRTCLVKLDEGPLIISNLVGDDAKTKIGARLSVTFERLTEEIAIPKFALE